MVSLLPELCALCLAGTFFLLAALHLVWIFRRASPGPKVIPSVDGRPLFRPGPASTLAVALALAAAGIVSLWRIGLVDWGHPWIPQVGIWVIAVLFLARAVGDFRHVGFFKRPTDSAFARLDTRFYSPLCLLVSLAAVGLAVLAPAPP